MSKTEAKRRRREKIEETKQLFQSKCDSFLKDSSTSPSVLAGIPFLLLTSSEPGVPEDYKRILEAEMITRLVSCLMDEDNPRAMILMLTQGSILNDVFREFFCWCDSKMDQSAYCKLYRDSLDALDGTIQKKLRSLDQICEELERDAEQLDYDLGIDDLPF